MVRGHSSVQLMVGSGRPSVGFVSVGSASSTLQCLPRSGGGINVFMGSDMHYISRHNN